jgi:hypothetical protein
MGGSCQGREDHEGTVRLTFAHSRSLVHDLVQRVERERAWRGGGFGLAQRFEASFSCKPVRRILMLISPAR